MSLVNYSIIIIIYSISTKLPEYHVFKKCYVTLCNKTVESEIPISLQTPFRAIKSSQTILRQWHGIWKNQKVIVADQFPFGS